MPRGGLNETDRKREKEETAKTMISFACTSTEKEMINKLSKKSGLSRSKFIMACIYYFEKSMLNKN